MTNEDDGLKTTLKEYARDKLQQAYDELDECIERIHAKNGTEMVFPPLKECVFVNTNPTKK